MNLFENGNTIQNHNQTGFLFTESQFDPSSIPSNSLTGDSEIIEVPNFHLNGEAFQANSIVPNLSENHNWSLFNDSNINKINSPTDNMITNNFATNLAQYDKLNLNQISKNFLTHNEIIPAEFSNYNYAPNLILTFPSNNEDPINIMSNVITFPNNNNQNNFDFIPQINGNNQWFTSMPRYQQIDPRSSYFVRQVDRNDRLNRNINFENGDQKYTKPVFSYSCLIALALKNSQTGSLPVNEIYRYMQENFPYFKGAPDGWKNSVRHNLSLNKAFQKNVRSDSSTTQRKGCLWTLKPDKRKCIDKEIKKWFKKHPDAIRKSMTNPENFHQYFNAEQDDSTEENSRPGSREEMLNSNSNSLENQTNVPFETQSSSLENHQFYQTGIVSTNLESSIPICDPFESQFNSFFNEFCPQNWNAFNLPSNGNSKSANENNLNKKVDLSVEKF